MPNCPVCQLALRTVRQREGIYFFCDQCGGRALTVAQLRRTTGDRFAGKLIRQMNTTAAQSSRECPFCASPMKQVALTELALMLDTCRPCTALWLGPGQFEALPEDVIVPPEELAMQGREAGALWKLERERELQQAQEGLAGEAPEEGWKWLPAMLGFPVELDAHEVTRRPWVTWSLAAIILGISVLAFFDLENAVHRFGLIPAEFWRYGGLTVLTSFFLHAGIFHLLGNLYFFLIFGDNVEDYVGRWRFLGLIFAAAAVGDVLHTLADPRGMVPCVGASGGISGVLAFYALAFPRARLGFLFRFFYYFRWIRFPAWVAFVLWMLLQCFGAWEQVVGISQVASLAHLGGALTGFGMWLWWRRLKPAAAPATLLS